jgi:AcrR family transcriptional regulator
MARPKVEGHKTAQDILASAQKHFLEKGFAGASINEIAKEAKVNKSLIYHHYGSKEGLWKAVKKRILEEQLGASWKSKTFDTASLGAFLDDFLSFRFYLYAEHDDLVRLMQWQRLAPQSDQLIGISELNAVYLENELKTLQEKGELRHDIPLDVINYLIFSLASNYFLDGKKFLETPLHKQNYLSIIKTMLHEFLNSKGV